MLRTRHLATVALARRTTLAVATVGLAATLLLTAATGSAAAGRPLFASPTTPIQHVVFILKENRSFDDYLGAYCESRYPGDPASCDGATREPSGQYDASLNYRSVASTPKGNGQSLTTYWDATTPRRRRCR